MSSNPPAPGRGKPAPHDVFRDNMRIFNQAIVDIRLTIDASRAVIAESLQLIRQPLDGDGRASDRGEPD